MCPNDDDLYVANNEGRADPLVVKGPVVLLKHPCPTFCRGYNGTGNKLLRRLEVLFFTMEFLLSWYNHLPKSNLSRRARFPTQKN